MQSSQNYEVRNCSLEELIQREYNIKIIEVKKLVGYETTNYKVQAENGESIIKIYTNLRQLEFVKNQTKVLLHLHQKQESENKYSKPIPFHDGQYVKVFNWNNVPVIVRMITFLKGNLFDDCEKTPELIRSLAQFVANLNNELKNEEFPQAYQSDFNTKNYHFMKNKLHYVKNPIMRNAAQHFIQLYEQNVVPLSDKLRKATIHNDINELNIIVNDERVTGLIDFGDMAYWHLMDEIVVAMYHLGYSDEDSLKWSLILLEEYNKINPLTQEQVNILYEKIGIRCSMIVVNCQEAKAKNPNNSYLSYKFDRQENMLLRWSKYNKEEIQKLFFQKTNIYN